jgi:hypothetical protein
MNATSCRQLEEPRGNTWKQNLVGVPIVLVVMSALAFASIKYEAVKAWACDRVDTLPRDVAGYKIEQRFRCVAIERVTGIRVVSERERIADVEYHYRGGSSCFPNDGRHTEQWKFQLYDDGWRP